MTKRLSGQDLTYDGVPAPADSGAQNGGGNWDTATLNWYDLLTNKNVAWVNDGTYNAAFGNSNSNVGGTINVAENIFVNDMRFNSLQSTPLLASGMTHTFTSTNGSVLNFSDGAYITMAENSSSGSGTILFVNYNLTVKAKDLSIARDPGASGATFQYLRFANDNDLTGTLTLEAVNAAKGIFLLTGNDFTLAGLDKVVVQAGSVLATSAPVSTGHDYTTEIHIAGNGAGNGAIRVDSSGIDYTGKIVLIGDAGIMTNSSTQNTVISGGITESGGSFGFARFASANDNIVSIIGASNYTGATTFGRSGSVAGGITILDFSKDESPEEDILYHEVPIAGQLNLIGGVYGRAALTLQGKADTPNSQRFGNLSATGTRTTVSLISGSGGSMSLSLGTITRVLATTTLAFTTPQNGTITTTQSDGLIGPWTTIADSSGNGGWAQASSGVLTTFTGTTAHTTGSTLDSYSDGADLRIDGTSHGIITGGAVNSILNTLTQADTYIARLVDTGNGNTLQLAQLSGIQVVGEAQDLIVGRSGTAGSLTAGTTTGAHLFLTNMSPTSKLTINSQIVNNAAGAVNLYVNGTGNVILAGNNTFTGTVQIAAGSLEIRNNNALGTTAGATTVLFGGSLRLSGGITTPEALTVAGSGVSNDGAIRNIAGNNTFSGLVTVNGPARINSDTGMLTFQGASATTNVISSTSIPITFGGAGTIVVNGRINSTSTTITKDGAGLLVLAGDNNYTGLTTVSNGILRIGHVNALGTTASATTINLTGAVELNGTGYSITEAFTLASTGINQGGGLRNTGGNNTLAAVVTIAGTSRIQSLDGTLTIDAASGANALIKDNTTSNRTLTFGGAGNIVVVDAIAKQNTGIFSVGKDGSGTLTLQGISTYDGATTLAGGEMHLDFTGVATPTNLLHNGAATAGNLSMAGSTLRITGKAGSTTSQHFGSLAIATGQSYFKVVQNGATAVNVSFGNFTRAVSGGVLDFTPPTTGTLTTTGGADNTVITVDGIAAVTWGKNDWAATTAISGSVRQIVGLSSISGGYTASTATSLAGNADVVSGAGSVNLAASANITSLRFNADQTNSITLASGTILTTGGILVGEGAGAHDTTIQGGTLRSSSTNTSFGVADLVIVQNNTLGNLIITSVIGNNTGTSSSTSLTKTGAGTVILDTVTHLYSGTTKVTEGTLYLRTGNIDTAGQYTLGGGATSGKFKLGNDTTAITLFSDWLQIDGTGTQNALVGGGLVLSTFLLDGGGITSDFRRGFIGGSARYENNISIRMAAENAPLQLGSFNTYAGKTTISNGIIEVEKLANLGEVSSLGTGTFSGTSLTGDSGIIDLSTRTTSAVGANAISYLRYIGSTDSSTNRIVRISNSDVETDITAVIAVLENTGTGTVKFTSAFLASGSNPVQRVLRLSGTNTGANEIVGISNASASILTRVEKTGTGTWTITGSSAHSGGTYISQGILLAKNSSGSATGTGTVVVSDTGRLGGTGRVAPGAGNNVSISGGILTVGDTTLAAPAAGRLEIATTGGGALTFENFGSLELDLFYGAGLGDNTSDAGAADVLVVNGNISIQPGSVLRIVSPDEMIEWAAGDQWRLIDWTTVGTISGSFGIFDLPSLDPSLEWDISKLYTAGTIGILAVPEPSRMLLMLLSGALALFHRRRR